MNILNFINTLIFSIIAATASVVILFLMFAPNMENYMLMLGIVEVGLVSIVIWCLVSIVNYEVKITENRMNAKNATGSLPGCPDNWTVSRSQAVTDNKGNITSVQYDCTPSVSFDDAKRGEYFKYTFAPTADAVAATTAFTRVNEKVGAASNIDLCTAYINNFAPNPQTNARGIAAWTGLESKCDTLAY